MVLYLMPWLMENFFPPMPTYPLAPSSEAETLASNFFGCLYVMSKADDILSPYFASNPPEEKLTASTMSGLMTLSPSCCPLLISNGR